MPGGYSLRDSALLLQQKEVNYGPVNNVGTSFSCIFFHEVPGSYRNYRSHVDGLLPSLISFPLEKFTIQERQTQDVREITDYLHSSYNQRSNKRMVLVT